MKIFARGTTCSPLAIAQEMEKSAKANGFEVAHFEKQTRSARSIIRRRCRRSSRFRRNGSSSPDTPTISAGVRKQMVDQQIAAGRRGDDDRRSWPIRTSSRPQARAPRTSPALPGGILPNNIKRKGLRLDRQFREAVQGEHNSEPITARPRRRCARAVPDGIEMVCFSTAKRSATNSPSSMS